MKTIKLAAVEDDLHEKVLELYERIRKVLVVTGHIQESSDGVGEGPEQSKMILEMFRKMSIMHIAMKF